MLKSIISKLTVLFLTVTTLSSCTSTLPSDVKLDPIERVKTELVLEPVKFTVIQQDGTVYYALTDKYYINLSVNMVRIQQVLYEYAVWENINAKGIKDDGDKDRP